MAKKKKPTKKPEQSEQFNELVKFVSEIHDQLVSNGTAVVDATQLDRVKKLLCGTPGHPC